MTKSQLDELERLYILHNELDYIQGKLQSTLTFKYEQGYHPRIQTALLYISSKANQIDRMSKGMAEYPS